MKKLLALCMALVLLALPILPARAEGDLLAQGTHLHGDSDSGDGSGDKVIRRYGRPAKDKSLATWEEEREEIALTGDLREDILIIARSQIDYCADGNCFEVVASGARRYYTRYGEWYGRPFSEWCDMFVSFCVYYGGKTNYPREYSCSRHMLRLKQKGYWREWNSYMPQKGDLVFFALDSDNNMPSHVGLVEEVVLGEGNEGGYLITIEGNIADPKGGTARVQRMVRTLDRVVGYGTYEKGKVYPKKYSVRLPSTQIIDRNSPYFVDYPQEEVLRFLGLYNTPYYTYWFPVEETEEAQDEALMEEPAASPEPEAAEAPEATPTPASWHSLKELIIGIFTIDDVGDDLISGADRRIGSLLLPYFKSE